MKVVNSGLAVRIHLVLECILYRWQEMLGKVMSIMVTIEDPAHAKMAASMGRIQMTVQWLLYDLVLTQNVSLSIP